jgi:hypothetical protein
VTSMHMWLNQRTTTIVCSKPSISTSNSYPSGKSEGATTSICCTVIRPRDDGIPTDETTRASAVEAELEFEWSSGVKWECVVRGFMVDDVVYLFVVSLEKEKTLWSEVVPLRDKDMQL